MRLCLLFRHLSFMATNELDDRKRHNILMVSDFFYPNFGGVESHIYYLSQCLLKLGHKVRFIVGGDGPKRVRLEQMREKHSLQDRVEMLGAVPHTRVRSVLITGHIFLNSSLTEAFCIAILEAASCGLLTVSTRVGGVPEVLPDDMIVLAEPSPTDMVHAIKKAIHILPKINPHEMHLRLKSLYSWHDVAKRTTVVYDRALRCSDENLLDRLSRYLNCGAWAGKLFCLVMIVDFLLWHILQLWQPSEDIEVVPDIMLQQQHEEMPQSFSVGQSLR